MKTQRTLSWTAGIAMLIGLYFAATAPPDVVQGEFVRIFYVHVSTAWVAFAAFGVTLVGSLLWLITKRPVADRTAAAAAEIGVFFTALAILTGMIWGEPVWGTPWNWGDARLVSTAVMFFVYVGYLALRRSIPDLTSRANRSAVLGTMAFLMVPAVYFSVNLWRTLHQGPTIRPDGVTMDPEMLRAFLFNLAAFSILFAAMLVSRVRLQFAIEATESASPSGTATLSQPDLEML
jgi:heme exporter protein C